MKKDVWVCSKCSRETTEPKLVRLFGWVCPKCRGLCVKTGKEVEEIKDLGWLNDWHRYDNFPEEFMNCQYGDEVHDVDSVNAGRCVTRHTCHTCNITWTVDSSD